MSRLILTFVQKLNEKLRENSNKITTLMPHNAWLVIHDKKNNACIHYQKLKIREHVLEKDN